MHQLKRVDDNIFLDRDSKTFQALISYLRNDRKVYPQFQDTNDQRMFQEELNFWGIKDDRLDELKLSAKFPARIVEMIQQEPGSDLNSKVDVSDVVKQTWNLLGPLRLTELIKNSVDTVDFNLDFGQTIDKFNTLNQGQQNPKTGKMEGICRMIFSEPNGHLYEGQCKNERRDGWGRQIYCDGNYYIGHWKDNKKNGWGKKVYIKSGKIEEGNWENGELRN